MALFLSIEDDTIIFGLEPLHGVVLVEPVGEADAAGLPLPVSNVHTGTPQNNVEIHTVNTDGGVVFDTQIDVFLDTETEIAVHGEVFTTQLVFTDLEEKLGFD